MPNYDSLKNITKIKNLTILSLVLFFTVAICNLISSNVLSTQGIAVNAAEVETLKLEKENQILLVKIEEQSQLRVLEETAKSQGFSRVSNIVFAPTPATVALR